MKDNNSTAQKSRYIYYNGHDADCSVGADVLTIARQWNIDPFKAVDVLTEKGIPMLYGNVTTPERWNKFKKGVIV